MEYEDTYNIEDVVVRALATGIADIISNTRNMLITMVFFFMISPLFAGKELVGFCFFWQLPSFSCRISLF